MMTEERDAAFVASLRDIKQRMMVKTANKRRTKFDLDVMIALQMAADRLAKSAPQPPLPSSDGWIPHDGGPCPVGMETRVKIRFRIGSEDEEVAGVYDWFHRSTVGDIIAYKPEPSPTPSVAAPVAGAGEAQSLRAEVERLRAALERIAHPQYGLGFNKLRGIARAALATSEGEG